MDPRTAISLSVWLPAPESKAIGTSIGIDHTFHRLIAVTAIGRPERPSRPKGCLAGARPQREIGHARKPFQADVGQPPDAFHHRIEQYAKQARAFHLECCPQFRLGPAAHRRN
jgi:hypothetical protein